MGRTNALLKLGDKSLLGHMIQLLSTVAAPVRVVGRGEFLDLIPQKGRLGESLLHYSPLIVDSNLFLAVDLPLLTPEFLQVFHSRFCGLQKTAVRLQNQRRVPSLSGHSEAADGGRRGSLGKRLNSVQWASILRCLLT